MTLKYYFNCMSSLPCSPIHLTSTNMNSSRNHIRGFLWWKRFSRSSFSTSLGAIQKHYLHISKCQIMHVFLPWFLSIQFTIHIYIVNNWCSIIIIHSSSPSIANIKYLHCDLFICKKSEFSTSNITVMYEKKCKTYLWISILSKK